MIRESCAVEKPVIIWPAKAAHETTRIIIRRISTGQKQKCVTKTICAEWKLAGVIVSINAKNQTCLFDTMQMNVIEIVKNSERAKSKEKKNWNCDNQQNSFCARLHFNP